MANISWNDSEEEQLATITVTPNELWAIRVALRKFAYNRDRGTGLVHTRETARNILLELNKE